MRERERKRLEAAPPNEAGTASAAPLEAVY
jgi:hypothetical protein